MAYLTLNILCTLHFTSHLITLLVLEVLLPRRYQYCPNLWSKTVDLILTLRSSVIYQSHPHLSELLSYHGHSAHCTPASQLLPMACSFLPSCLHSCLFIQNVLSLQSAKPSPPIRTSIQAPLKLSLFPFPKGWYCLEMHFSFPSSCYLL